MSARRHWKMPVVKMHDREQGRCSEISGSKYLSVKWHTPAFPPTQADLIVWASAVGFDSTEYVFLCLFHFFRSVRFLSGRPNPPRILFPLGFLGFFPDFPPVHFSLHSLPNVWRSQFFIQRRYGRRASSLKKWWHRSSVARSRGNLQARFAQQTKEHRYARAGTRETRQ
jgi:hypothetical protein